jgi:hypothetical protein
MGGGRAGPARGGHGGGGATRGGKSGTLHRLDIEPGDRTRTAVPETDGVTETGVAVGDARSRAGRPAGRPRHRGMGGPRAAERRNVKRTDAYYN